MAENHHKPSKRTLRNLAVELHRSPSPSELYLKRGSDRQFLSGMARSYDRGVEGRLERKELFDHENKDINCLPRHWTSDARSASAGRWYSHYCAFAYRFF
jgi:hypothetical protein